MNTEETVPCGLCGTPTRMTGTKRCDRCFELEGRVRRQPDIARRVLAGMTPDPGAAPPAQPQSEPRIDPMQNPMRPGYFMNYAENETPAEMVLRKLACWLGVGGYNAPTVDADLFHKKIVDGVQLLLAAQPLERAAQQEAPTHLRVMARALLNTLEGRWHCDDLDLDAMRALAEYVLTKDPAAR